MADVILTPTEHAEVLRQIALWPVCPKCDGEGIRGINLEPPDQGIHWCDCVKGRIPGPIYLTTFGGAWLPPSRFVEATGPCERMFCIDGRLPAIGDASGATIPCPSCEGTGRKRAELATRCPKHMGRLAFTEHGASGVFDRCPNCDSSTGSVLFAYATIEILPVYDLDGSRDALIRQEAHVWPNDSRTVKVWRPNQHDPIWREVILAQYPVPGRDWVVMLDGVVLA